MSSKCCEFVDSRLRRSPPDRASAVPYGQAGENAMRFPHLAHRSAAAHKLHSTPQQDRMNLISGKDETSSRLPGPFSLFLPGCCPNNRNRCTVCGEMSPGTHPGSPRQARSKLPFLAEICRVLTTNGIFAVADTMPHRPEACCLGLIVYFCDIMVNVWNACRSDDRRRSQLVNRLPRYFRPLAREWVSLPGSTRFGQFERKERCCFIALMVKGTALSTAAA